jgi:hypothetical protein
MKHGFNFSYDEKLQAIVMEWNGYFTSEQFRLGTEFMLQMIRQHSATKVLALIQNMTLIGMEDQQWLEKEFLPRAIEAGFKACALLKPKNYFNKVAVENITYKIDQQKLRVNMFETEEQARNWLLEVNEAMFSDN